MKTGYRTAILVAMLVLFGGLLTLLSFVAFHDFSRWEREKALRHQEQVDRDRTPLHAAGAFLGYMFDRHPLQQHGVPSEPGEYEQRDDARMAFFVLLLAGGLAAPFAATAGPGSTIPLLAAGICSLLCGLVNVLPAAFHTIGVLVAMVAERPFRYDFVRYSAILYGFAWGIPAFVCLVSARGLTRGDPTAHRRATWASWALVIVNAPAIAITPAASIPVVLGSASAAVLLVARRNLRRTDHQE